MSPSPSEGTPSEGAKTIADTAASARPVDEDDFVDLLVGGHPYRTTRAVLLSSPFHDEESTYFHALLSGRWKRPKRHAPIELPDQDGRLFFYVLYYLQVGELPRATESAAHNSLLSKEDIDALESQAEFFGLTGLVDLCKITKDVLKGTGGTGDFDLTPISNFSVKIDNNDTRYYSEFNFSMKYTYEGITEVSVTGSGSNVKYSVNGYTTENGNSSRPIHNESFSKMFERLKALIEEAHCQKKAAGKEEDKEISVSYVMQQANIAPEVQLWYAFVITDMIDYYINYEHWDGEFGDAVEFLFSDTSSCFVCGMKTVE